MSRVILLSIVLTMRISLLLPLTLATTFNECQNESLALECLQYCSAVSNECQDDCGSWQNGQCLIECGAKLNDCLSFCPCQSKCPNSCVGCKSVFCDCHSGNEVPGLAEFQCTPGDFVCIETCWREYDENKLLCPCQSGCPKGCPCPDYQCPAKTTTTSIITTATTETTTTPYVPRKSVLILAHSTKAIITDGSGKEEHPVKDFLFMFGANTEVAHSCSVIWRSELFIFGGMRERRQVSKLKGCKLERVGNLVFDHREFACGVVNDDYIYLCFNRDLADYKKCRQAREPLGIFQEINPSNYEHTKTRIAASPDALLAIGSHSPYNKKVEMLEVIGSQVQQWRGKEDYPYVKSNAFYVFGGLVDYQPSNIIGRLDAATTTWSMAGELKVARSFHGAIFNGDAFIIAGGSRKWDETDDPAAYPTEHCSTNNGSVNCVEKAPILQYYANYPEMNLVPESFCKEM